jgi:dTMP kinase
MPALFISLDGLDGTGKSTQCRALTDWLHSQRLAVTACTDPGGTPVGDTLRTLVLDSRRDMSLTCETLLYMASRAELVARVIRPALAAGNMVVSDRFLLANVVYQGHAGGLAVDDLWRIGRLCAGGLEPDLTLVLDMPVEQAQARRGRAADRVEQRDREYHERVRQGFLAEAHRRPDRIRVIDARPPAEDVQRAIRAAVEPLLADGRR